MRRTTCDQPRCAAANSCAQSFPLPVLLGDVLDRRGFGVGGAVLQFVLGLLVGLALLLVEHADVELGLVAGNGVGLVPVVDVVAVLIDGAEDFAQRLELLGAAAVGDAGADHVDEGEPGVFDGVGEQLGHALHVGAVKMKRKEREEGCGGRRAAWARRGESGVS
jgi:hypothetical protein